MYAIERNKSEYYNNLLIGESFTTTADLGSCHPWNMIICQICENSAEQNLQHSNRSLIFSYFRVMTF